MLRRANYQGTLEEFHHQLRFHLKHFWPGWTADKLICNPREAVQYCDKINRWMLACECFQLNDETILKALLNLRKQKKLETQRGKETPSS